MVDKTHATYEGFCKRVDNLVSNDLVAEELKDYVGEIVDTFFPMWFLENELDSYGINEEGIKALTIGTLLDDWIKENETN